jgi:hypothetical protein
VIWKIFLGIFLVSLIIIPILGIIGFILLLMIWGPINLIEDFNFKKREKIINEIVSKLINTSEIEQLIKNEQRSDITKFNINIKVDNSIRNIRLHIENNYSDWKSDSKDISNGFRSIVYKVFREKIGSK